MENHNERNMVMKEYHRALLSTHIASVRIEYRSMVGHQIA